MLTENVALLKAFFLYVNVVRMAREYAANADTHLPTATPKMRACFVGIVEGVAAQAERKLFEMFDGEFKATPPSMHLLN